jgi:hypothetical protein
LASQDTPHKTAALRELVGLLNDRAALAGRLLSRDGVKCFGAAEAQASERCFRFASAASSGVVSTRGSNGKSIQVNITFLAPQNNTTPDVQEPVVRGDFIGSIIIVMSCVQSYFGMGCVQHPPIGNFVDAAEKAIE